MAQKMTIIVLGRDGDSVGEVELQKHIDIERKEYPLSKKELVRGYAIEGVLNEVRSIIERHIDE